jgi:hypothetical protein
MFYKWELSHNARNKWRQNNVPSFPSCGATAQIGPRPGRWEFSRPHTPAQLVALLWTSDQSVSQTAIHTTHKKYKRRIATPSAGFERMHKILLFGNGRSLQKGLCCVSFVYQLPAQTQVKKVYWRDISLSLFYFHPKVVFLIQQM